MKTDFHSIRKSWAETKHSILSQYLQLFLGKLGKSADRVFYVDGFAGPGLLEDGSKGSALLAAEGAANPKQSSRNGLLHCINVEKTPEVFANLEAATAPYKAHVTNIKNAFGKALPKVLELIGNHPALFFIDPFGTEGVEVETLKIISERKAPTEVLVRYDDTRVKRLISWAINNRENLDPSKRASAESLWKRVENLADDKAAHDVFEQMIYEEREAARQTLVDSYCEVLKRKSSFRYALSFPIRNPNTRGHRYYLVHFCSHPDGYIYMAHFMAGADRAYEHKASTGGDLFGGGGEQLAFPLIDRHIQSETRINTIQKITRALPELFAQADWHGLKSAETTPIDTLKPDGNRAVMYSSTTDPYQVIRHKDSRRQRELSAYSRYVVRRSLELIRDHSTLRVRILTRSPLAKSDFDLFKSFGSRLLFGMSLPTLRDDLSRIYEPKAPAPLRRLETLQAARAAGLNIYVAVAPTYPECDEADLRATLTALAPLEPVTIFHEPINIRAENVARIASYASKLGVKAQTGVFDTREAWQDYALQSLRTVRRLARELGLERQLHLWPDRSLGSNSVLARQKNPKAYLERLHSVWAKVSNWPE